MRKSQRETEGRGKRGSEASERGTGSFRQPLHSASADMPNFAGTWKMKRSENFDELLKALGKPSPASLPLLSSLPSLARATSLHEADNPSCPYRKRLFLFFENDMPDFQQHGIVRRSSLGKERRDLRGDAAGGKSLSFTGDMKHWMLNSSLNRRGIVT